MAFMKEQRLIVQEKKQNPRVSFFGNVMKVGTC